MEGFTLSHSPETDARFAAQTAHYVALDAVVETFTEKLGSDPIGQNYETGGHVAVAHWMSEDAHLLVTVILAETVEDCEIITSELRPATSCGSLAELESRWAL